LSLGAIAAGIASVPIGIAIGRAYDSDSATRL
jgi:hypothetical protein